MQEGFSSRDKAGGRYLGEKPGIFGNLGDGIQGYILRRESNSCNGTIFTRMVAAGGYLYGVGPSRA
jgi:hypothetical protein